MAGQESLSLWRARLELPVDETPNGALPAFVNAHQKPRLVGGRFVMRMGQRVEILFQPASTRGGIHRFQALRERALYRLTHGVTVAFFHPLSNNPPRTPFSACLGRRRRSASPRRNGKENCRRNLLAGQDAGWEIGDAEMFQMVTNFNPIAPANCFCLASVLRNSLASRTEAAAQ